MCFIDLQAFGRTAEVIAEYFHQGDPIHVEGRLRFRQWESAEGEKRSKHDLLIDGFEFVGGRSESQVLSDVNSTQTQPNGRLDFGDDIPF